LCLSIKQNTLTAVSRFRTTSAAASPPPAFHFTYPRAALTGTFDTLTNKTALTLDSSFGASGIDDDYPGPDQKSEWWGITHGKAVGLKIEVHPTVS